MKPIVDIHCHILPGVDDGSFDMEETKKLLKIAYEEGVRVLCLTPHYQPERWDISAGVIEEKYEQVRAEAKKKTPDLQLLLGNELYYRSHSRQALEEGRCRTMGESRYVLVEFNPAKEFREMDRGLYELQAEGYTPILAHVERYQCLKKNISRIEDFVEKGICIQMNAGSLTGELGFMQTRYAKKLVERELVHVIASDAHDSVRRAPRFQKCRHYLNKTFGEEYGDMLLHDNPLHILRDEDL